MAESSVTIRPISSGSSSSRASLATFNTSAFPRSGWRSSLDAMGGGYSTTRPGHVACWALARKRQGGKEGKMELRDVMTKDVKVVGPFSTLREAAEQMAQLDIGALPVSDGEKLIGMVTDRDITIRATAEGRDPNVTKVTDIMTPDLVYCYDDDSTDEAARKMRQ